MSVETEVKFSVPDQQVFDELKALSQLGNFQLRPLGSKIITDRYLDTPDRRFIRAGYACRLRSAKQGYILTLKSLTPPEGGIHRREEIEAKVDTDNPETWPDSEAKKLAAKIAGDESLQTLFRLHQVRHKHHAVVNGRTALEFSLDEVTYGEDNSGFELEAELLEAGTENDLVAFTAALTSAWNLTPENKSKFERGYARQFGRTIE